MSGFLGQGDRKIKTAREADMERREQHRRDTVRLPDLEKRSWEKIQGILQDQEEVDAEAEREKKGTKMCEMADRGLALTVGEVMAGKVATVQFDDTVMVVKGIFESVSFHHLPVVDAGDRVIGILSDRDFLKSISPFLGTINEQNRDVELLKTKVGLIMTRNPNCLSAHTGIIDAIHLMNRKKVSCIPIVELPDNRLLGVVTWKDIVRAFCPEGFSHPKDSARLKTGVSIRAKAAGNAKPKAAEGAGPDAPPDAPGAAGRNDAGPGLGPVAT